MWYIRNNEVRRNSEFFRVALSHESLANYLQTNFGLIQHHGWSLNELDDMHPWEREIYVSSTITTS